MHNVMNIDQTAYIMGRNISESMRLLEDLLYYADVENERGILYAADMEKRLTQLNTILFFYARFCDINWSTYRAAS